MKASPPSSLLPASAALAFVADFERSLESVMIRVKYHNAFFHNHEEEIQKITNNASQNNLHFSILCLHFFKLRKVLADMTKQTRSNITGRNL